MKLVFRAALAGLAFLSSPVAYAVNIGFEDVEGDRFYDAVSSAGFDIAGAKQFSIASSPSWCSPQCPQNGTQTLTSYLPVQSFSLQHADGLSFDLVSFEYGEGHLGFPYATMVRADGNLVGGGTVSASFPLDNINDGSGPLVDFQVATLPITFRGLASVTFVAVNSGTGNTVSLDNIVANPVPEPSSVALASLGVCGLLAYRFRRRGHNAL